MFTLYLFGGFGGLWLFWTILLLESVAIIYWVDDESPGKAFTSLLVVGAVLHFFADPTPFAWFLADWTRIAYTVGIYIIGGGPYALYRWWSYNKRISGRFDDFFDDWKTSKEIVAKTFAALSDEEILAFRKHCLGNAYRPYDASFDKDGIRKVTQARDHIGNILTWIAYWPWCLIWTLIDDPIRRFSRFVWRTLSSAMQGIADREHAKYDDLNREIPPPAWPSRPRSRR